MVKVKNVYHEYKPMFNIIIAVFSSWAISYFCSVVVEKTTFEIFQNKNIHLRQGEYVLFLRGDNPEKLVKAGSELNMIYLFMNGNVIGLPINKARKRSFPVEVGIEHFEPVGLVRITEDGRYRLSSDLTKRNLGYVLAEDYRFRSIYAFVMVIGVVASLFLVAVVLNNALRLWVSYTKSTEMKNERT